MEARLGARGFAAPPLRMRLLMRAQPARAQLPPPASAHARCALGRSWRRVALRDRCFASRRSALRVCCASPLFGCGLVSAPDAPRGAAPARRRRPPLAAWPAWRPARAARRSGVRAAAKKEPQPPKPPPPVDDDAPMSVEELLATPPADPTAGPTWQEPHPLDPRRWDLKEAWRFPRKHRDYVPQPDPRSMKAFFDPEGRRPIQLPRTDALDRAPAEFDHHVFLGPSAFAPPSSCTLAANPLPFCFAFLLFTLSNELTPRAFHPYRPRRAAAARRGRQL